MNMVCVLAARRTYVRPFDRKTRSDPSSDTLVAFVGDIIFSLLFSSIFSTAALTMTGWLAFLAILLPVTAQQLEVSPQLRRHNRP